MMNKKILSTLLVCLLSVCAAFAASKQKGIALQKDCSLWTKKSAGLMEYALTIEPGTEIDVYVENDKLVSEKATWTTSKDKTELVFVKCVYKNTDYYIIQNRFAYGRNISAAVVYTDSAAYNSANLADVRAKKIDGLTIIAVDDDFIPIPSLRSVYDEDSTFCRVYWFDENAYTVRRGFMLDTKFSVDRDDITASRVVKAALATSDSSKRSELLSNISELNVSYQMNEAIEGVFEDKSNDGDLSSYGEYWHGDEKFTIVSDDGSAINVRDKPGINAGGNVIAQLHHGDVVISEGGNMAIEYIDGIGAHWMHITSPVDGWIFGAYASEIVGPSN